MFYVYVCQQRGSGRLYVGRTRDLKRRIEEHQQGRVWTTRRMSPFRLVFYECFLSQYDAIRRERYFKTQKGKSTLKMMLRNSLVSEMILNVKVGRGGETSKRVGLKTQ